MGKKTVQVIKILTIIGAICLMAVFASSNTYAANGTWHESGGSYWYEYADGSYAQNEYIDGYWINSSGWYDSAWNGSWKGNSSGWWFESGSWYPTNQWLKVDGSWYHFDGSGYLDTDKWIGNYYVKSSGAMAVNEWIGDYYVGSDGAWVPGKEKAKTPTEPDLGERVEGNTNYGHYETKTETYEVYVAPDGTEFTDYDAFDDYCWDNNFASYDSTPKTRTREIQVWVWDR